MNERGGMCRSVCCSDKTLAFEGLGFEKTASIQAVAPGIAEALVATAAGLFAAIPAVIAYNQFISKIKNIGAEMDDFSSEFLNLVERSFS